MKGTLDSVHVYQRGELNRAGDPHMASMDCWCEPKPTLTLEINGGPTIPVIVHGDGIIAAKVVTR